MADINKVIKGLECCQYSSKSHCDGCPYVYGDSINVCTADLATDTITLLKEQADTIKQDDHREGYWIQQYDSIGRHFSICSECRTSFAAYDKHGKIVHQDMSNTNFCPCCGADMRTVERILGKDVWSGTVKPLKKRSDKKDADGIRGDSDNE